MPWFGSISSTRANRREEPSTCWPRWISPNWKANFGDTAALVFGDYPANLPAEPMKVPLADSPNSLEISFSGCTLVSPPQQRTTMADPLRVKSSERAPFSLVGSDINIRMRFPDDKVRRVTFYCLHRQDPGRTQVISVTDVTTNSALDRKQIAKFADGLYVSFDISGTVDVHFRPGPGSRVASVSALLIDPQK